MRLATQIIVPAVIARGEEQVEDRLVDRQVDAADVRSIQGSSLNSFWGLNSSFLPSLPKIT